MIVADPKAFFDHLRAGLMGPVLTESEVAGTNAILAATASWPLAWAAYGLATAWHETAHTMQPVKELGGPAYFFRMYDPGGQRPEVAKRLGNTEPGDGALFAGRGYPQLTGRANYQRADDQLALGGRLVAQPDIALEPEIAAQIMEAGMREGWFTGLRLAGLLPQDSPAVEREFVAARKIINGLDRAELIAGYAIAFQAAF